MTSVSIATTGDLSVGAYIGYTTFGIAVILLFVSLVAFFLKAKRGYVSEAHLIGWMFLAGFLVVALLSGGAMYPFSYQYHHWLSVAGRVSDIGSRILSSGSEKGVSQRFVVTMDHHQFSCDDTRCSLVKPGDYLRLTCKREWQFAGTDGWSCNYVSRNEAPS